VKPASDRKLRSQFEAAVKALDEGAAALASGRRKPKRTGRKIVLTVLALAGIGSGVAYILSQQHQGVPADGLGSDGGAS
jgi:hypothetical protein